MASRRILLLFIISKAYVLLGAHGEICEPNHTKAHPDNVTLFYMCDAEGEFRLFCCPEGLHFNPLKPACDWPQKVEGDMEGTVDTYIIPEDYTIKHPINEMMHEGLNSEPTVGNYKESVNIGDHEKSDVEEHSETERDEHVMMKRESSDHEINEEEHSDSLPSADHDLNQEENVHPLVKEEEKNMSISDISKLKDVLISFLYILSAVPLSEHFPGENKTHYDYNHLGYYISGNDSSSGERSSHESHEETDSATHEDGEDTSVTGNKEPSSDMGFPTFYK